ncbi:hypothetical protein [Helicobacter sp. T3_23-1056]
MNLADKILEAKNLCHTERSEVSQNIDNRDISAFSKPQYDKKIKDLQSQIDDLVYKLYDLDSVQIKNHQILIIFSLSLSLQGESKKAFYYCDIAIKQKMLFCHCKILQRRINPHHLITRLTKHKSWQSTNASCQITLFVVFGYRLPQIASAILTMTQNDIIVVNCQKNSLTHIFSQ